MSLFWIFFLALAVSAFAEVFFHKNKNLGRILLILNLTFITLMLCFRYGEGSDYPTYEILYNAFSGDDWNGFLDYAIYTKFDEVGFAFLRWVFSSPGVPFAVFAALIAIIEAPLLYRFLDRYCVGFRCTGLMLLYPVYIFIYQFSGLRQGLTIALFLGLMLPLLEKKKWFPYFLLAVLCVLFHKVAILFFVLPLAYLIKERIAEVILGGSVLFSIVFGICRYFFKGSPGISISAYALRAAVFVVILILYHRSKPAEFDRIVYRLLCFGMAGYALLSSNPLVAGRFYDEIQFLSIILIVSFLRASKRTVILIGEAILILYTGLMLWKNLNTRCESGMKDTVNAFNYPYITVFNKERLYEYYAGGEQ